MLIELSIRNFAIIDDISITFHEGLTVLTGETGAGKSIIIDAVQLLAGARASTHYVRHGAKKAEISALCSIESEHIIKKLSKYDLEYEDDTLLLERTITKQGRSICKINNKIVTLAVLKEVGQHIVNIHSQHDTVQLMDEQTHIQLLDAFAGENIINIKAKYEQLYEKWNELQNTYKNLTANEQDMTSRLDFIQFQWQEIETANLQVGEDNQLSERRMRLQHYEKMYRLVDETYYLLTNENSILEKLDIAQQNLQEAKSIDEHLVNESEQVSSMFYQLEEVSFSLRNYLDNLYFDENELNDIESRLHDINHLKKKYGNSIEAILSYKQDIEKEIHQLENRDNELEQLQQNIMQLETNIYQIGEKLREERRKAAYSLEQFVKKELEDLYLEQASFKVDFRPFEKSFRYEGLDRVVFMISTNIGEPLNELAKIASGGELSRFMLALKNIFSSHDEISTLIFDEIDTGVSGRVAQAIAEKMYEITKHSQVLTITHLPQVAAMSDHHLLITKVEENERTSTKIIDLNDDEKVKEVGKMFTGTELTKSALEHAEQLLQLTNTFKQTVKKPD